GGRANDVETYVLHDGEVTLVALQRDATGAAERSDRAQAASSRSEAVVLDLPRSSFVYDLRAREALRRTGRPLLDLHPVEPTSLAISDKPMPAPTLSVPAQMRAGDTATIRFGLSGDSSAAQHVLHVEVVDPTGAIVAHYSGNLRASGGAAAWDLPLAFNDATG